MPNSTLDLKIKLNNSLDIPKDIPHIADVRNRDMNQQQSNAEVRR